MASEWQQHSLGDLCSHITDGKHGDCRDEDGSGFYFLSVKDVIGGRMVYDNARQITEFDFQETHRRTNLMSEDILFTNTGTIGRMAIAPEDPKTTRTTFQKSVAILKPRKELVLPRFLYYVLQFDNARLSGLAAGTTQKNLLLKDLRTFYVRIPSFPEQKAIAQILGTLDDKIELNRRMNATLEAMARALFQSWFVDFDPVRAKLDRRKPAGMDKATAALFPDRFQESAMGPIPNSWLVDTIKNRASNVQYGFTQSASRDPIGPHFLRITDISQGGIDWASVPYCQVTEDEREKYRVMDGDIVIARTGASTGDNVYVVEPPHAVFASYLIRIQFASRGLGRLVGEFTRTSDYASHVAGTIGGSAQPNASAQALAAAHLVFPTEEVADVFYRTVRPLDLMRAANDRESRTLATLRDTLLPKLLSGEISAIGIKEEFA